MTPSRLYREEERRRNNVSRYLLVKTLVLSVKSALQPISSTIAENSFEGCGEKQPRKRSGKSRVRGISQEEWAMLGSGGDKTLI